MNAVACGISGRKYARSLDPLPEALWIALGIDFEGKKQVLGLREGNTENGRVVKALLRDLVARELDPEPAHISGLPRAL